MPSRGRDLDPSDPDVALAREILLGTLLDSFRENRAATELENEIINDAGELRDALTGFDDRTFCILAVSFMEDALKRRFREQWGIKAASEESAYFGGNGPLSSFSHRLLIAKGLGWINNDDMKQASTLRKLRNFLAHNHRVHQIDCDPLLSLAETLAPLEMVFYREEMDNYVRAYDLAPKRTILRMRVYCNSIRVVSAALVRSKLMAAYLPTDLRDGSGFDSLTEVEQRFIDHTIQHCLRSLGIARTSSRNVPQTDRPTP